MNIQNLISLIQDCSIFTNEQKINLINKIDNFDENQIKNFYELIQKGLNDYDLLLNETYEITIQYKDELKENWGKYLKNTLFNIQENEDEKESLQAESLLEELNNL